MTTTPVEATFNTSSSDAARWTAAHASTSELTFGRGRSPRMTYMAWHVSQTTELGGKADGWYRRCVTRGCRIWAGPYLDVLEAKQDGMDHQHYAHEIPAAQARSAA